MKGYAVITGATGGIGHAFAVALAKAQHPLLLIGRNEEKLRDLQYNIQKSYNVLVSIIQVDLTKRTERQKIYTTLEQLDGEVELLINNAGIGYFGPFIKGEATETSMLQLNIEALTELSRCMLPFMKNGSTMIQVASTASFAPGPLMAVYYASKAYVLSFSLALREELKGTGIHVLTVCPGPTRTDFQARAQMKKAAFAMRFAMTPEAVVTSALRGVSRKKAVVIPGMINKLSSMTLKVLPLSWSTALVKLTQKQ